MSNEEASDDPIIILRDRIIEHLSPFEAQIQSIAINPFLYRITVPTPNNGPRTSFVAAQIMYGEDLGWISEIRKIRDNATRHLIEVIPHLIREIPGLLSLNERPTITEPKRNLDPDYRRVLFEIPDILGGTGFCVFFFIMRPGERLNIHSHRVNTFAVDIHGGVVEERYKIDDQVGLTLIETVTLGDMAVTYRMPPANDVIHSLTNPSGSEHIAFHFSMGCRSNGIPHPVFEVYHDPKNLDSQPLTLAGALGPTKSPSIRGSYRVIVDSNSASGLEKIRD